MKIEPAFLVGEYLRIKRDFELPEPDLAEKVNPKFAQIANVGALYRVNEIMVQVCYTTIQVFYHCKRYRIMAIPDEDFGPVSRKKLIATELHLLDEGKIIKLREDEVELVDTKKLFK